jgi:ADP-ribose pyrophosphatase YjhB (NUDIX family)
MIDKKKIDNSEAAFLRSYNIHDFDIPLVSIDVVIFTLKEKRLQVLIVKRPNLPELGALALPGGFIDIHNDRDIEAAALRKLEEKTGVRTPYLEQMGTVGNGSRDPRGWSVTVVYFALVNSNNRELGALSEDARWVDVTDPCLDNMAFDHSDLFQKSLARLRNKVAYSALPVHLLPEEFTLADLQKVYEIILTKPVEKSAFRRRIMDSDILEEIPGKKRPASNRPAQIYRVKAEQTRHFFAANIRPVTNRKGKSTAKA